ncbi:hypothetical protein THAOC_27727, partial [Thalassiosira oceanica]
PGRRLDPAEGPGGLRPAARRDGAGAGPRRRGGRGAGPVRLPGPEVPGGGERRGRGREQSAGEVPYTVINGTRCSGRPWRVLFRVDVSLLLSQPKSRPRTSRALPPIPRRPARTASGPSRRPGQSEPPCRPSRPARSGHPTARKFVTRHSKQGSEQSHSEETPPSIPPHLAVVKEELAVVPDPRELPQDREVRAALVGRQRRPPPDLVDVLAVPVSLHDQVPHRRARHDLEELQGHPPILSASSVSAEL